MNTGLKGPVFQSGLDWELYGQPGPPARHDYSSLAQHLQQKPNQYNCNPAWQPSCVAGAHVDATRLLWYRSNHLLLLIFRWL
jgi:hypothetical protein